MKIKVICAVAAVATVAVLTVLLLRDTRVEEPADVKPRRETMIKAEQPSVGTEDEKKTPGRRVSVIQRKGRRYKKGAKRNPMAFSALEFEDAEHPYSEADKKVAIELEEASQALDAFDEDDFRPPRTASPEALERAALAKKAMSRFLAAAAKAAKSANPAVRHASVEAYGWQGAELLPELTPLMADADPEVAEAAIDAVESRLDEMEDPALRFEAAAAYMDTFASNSDALDMFSSTLVSSAMEFIDAEDDSAAAEAQARNGRERVVDVLAELIEKGDSRVVAAAKESYSDITSEEWISVDEGKRWAFDPETYEAP